MKLLGLDNTLQIALVLFVKCKGVGGAACERVSGCHVERGWRGEEVNRGVGGKGIYSTCVTPHGPITDTYKKLSRESCPIHNF